MPNMLISSSKHLLFILLFFCAGVLFYLLYHQKLLIFWCSQKEHIHPIHLAQRKPFYLYFYKDDTLEVEEKELIASQDRQKTVQYLVTAWLNNLEEEQLSEKYVEIKAVLLDQQTTEAFISFDRNPFLKTSSIKHKLRWIEGLLKTVKKNIPQIQMIRFLVHHKPLEDSHLDFSQSWPTTGFLS